MNVRYLENSELIADLRKAAAIWFRNDHLLMLEELIRRHEILLSHQREWFAARQQGD